MLPEFIPYIVKVVSYIDSTTGKSHGWSYDKKYRLYHTPTEKIIRFPKIEEMFYVDEFLESSTSLILVCIDDDNKRKYTLVTCLEDIKSPLWFDYMTVITPKLISVRKDSKWGIINDRLQMKCFFEYDSLDGFVVKKNKKIYIVAERNGKAGLLNDDLSIKFPFEYISITCNYHLGIFVLQGQSSTTIYDIEDGSISIFPFVVNSIKEINEGCIVVEKNKQYCVFDKDKQCFITDKWFDDIDTFDKGFSLCNHRYILERNGQITDLGADLWFSRTGDIIYSSQHLEGDEWEVTVYKRNQFEGKFNHVKSRHGFFYCRVVDDEYLEVGSYSDKYSTHSPEALYDVNGVKVSSRNSGTPTTKATTNKIESISETRRYKSHSGKIYEVDNIEKFEDEHFKNSKHLTNSDAFELVELAPNLLRLETMSVDDGGCYWYLEGYIYNDINMWIDVKISND